MDNNLDPKFLKILTEVIFAFKVLIQNGGLRSWKFAISKKNTGSYYPAKRPLRSLLDLGSDMERVTLGFLPKMVPIITGEKNFFFVFSFLYGNQNELWVAIYSG